ncbi:MAG: antitoxin family protein [Cyanobacteria bacterium P01_A01_bin.40]
MERPTIVEAVYENGVLKPTFPLNLKEKQVVRVNVSPESEPNHPYIIKTANIYMVDDQ